MIPKIGEEISKYVEEMGIPEEQKKLILSNHQYQHELSYQVEDKKVLEFIESNNNVEEKELKSE